MQIEVYSGLSEDKNHIETRIGDFTIINDSPLKDKEEQPRHASQGQLFIAAAGACAASVAARYCVNHDLPLLKGIRYTVEYDEDDNCISKINYEIQVPKDFPQGHLDALIRAAGTCTVKRYWLNPPEFVTTTAYTE